MSEALAIRPAHPAGPSIFSAAVPAVRARLEGNLDPMYNLLQPYDDIVFIGAGPVRGFFLKKPEYVEELLVKNHKYYIKDPGYAILRRLLGNGLLTSEHDFHLRQRRMIQPAFHKQRVENYGREMIHYALQARERWQDGRQVEMNNEMMNVTLSIVGKTLLGAEVRDDAETVSEALTTMFKYGEIYYFPWLGKLWEMLPIPAARRCRTSMRDLNKLLFGIIAERRAAGEDRPDDLLTMLVEAMDADDGTGMTDQQIRDEVVTLFLAGHETTAVGLTWTWYLLSQHPEVEAKLHEEVDRVLGGADPEVHHFPQLQYTRQVFSESMRLYPPAFIFGRQATEDNEIGGYRIRKGEIVLVSPYLNHRDPQYFPEPTRFDPDRWTPEAVAQRHKFTYVPFSGGVRKCIGEGFAWMEAVLLLATFAQQYRPVLAPEFKFGLDPSVTLRPRHGMPMTLRRR